MIPDTHIEQAFEARGEACAQARAYVAGSLSGLLTGDRLFEVKVATSELVTNAIKYATGKFTVGIDFGSRHVIVHVVDNGDGATVPRARTVTDDCEGGRGLPLVQALTTATGTIPAARCCAAPSSTGTCCWFRIDLSRAGA